MTRAGTAKILDFGIAKLAQDPALPRGVATLTGVILGTAGYLAPEQVKGDPVDARTDLFALGSILFELMTGQRAFAREHTIDTLHAIVHDEPPDLLPRGTRTDRHRHTPARQGAGCQVSVGGRPAVGPGADRLDRGAREGAARAPARDSSARGEAGPWPARRSGDGPGGTPRWVAPRSGADPSARTQPHAVHLVASSGHRTRLGTGRLP